MGSGNIFEFALISIKVLIETSTFGDSADFSVSHDERARKVFLSVRSLSIAFQIPDLFFARISEPFTRFKFIA